MGKISRKRKGLFNKYNGDRNNCTDTSNKQEGLKKMIFILMAMLKKNTIQLGGKTSVSAPAPAGLDAAMANILSFLETVQEGPKEIMRHNFIRNLNEMERINAEEKESESKENKDDLRKS